MTRSDILQAATACVTADRNNTYGPPEDSFAVIGQYWSTYLGVPVGAAQVGTLLALMKIARMQANPGHADSYVDGAGYLACAGGIATAGASTPLFWHPEPKVTTFTTFNTDTDTELHTWLMEERGPENFRLWQEGGELLSWHFPDREAAVTFAREWEEPKKSPSVPYAEWHARNAASRTHQTAPDPERGGWVNTVSGGYGAAYYPTPVSAVVPQFNPDTIAVVCADEEPLNQPK